MSMWNKFGLHKKVVPSKEVNGEIVLPGFLDSGDFYYPEDANCVLVKRSDKGVDFNNLARRVARKEGKKKSVNIAQIREVLSIVLDDLACQHPGVVLKTLADRRVNLICEGKFSKKLK